MFKIDKIILFIHNKNKTRKILDNIILKVFSFYFIIILSISKFFFD